MDSNDVGHYFTIDGTDVWEMVSYCEYPTATMLNLKTGERKGGAVGSLLLRPFQRLVREQRPNEACR